MIFYDFLVEKDAAEDGVDYDDEGKEESADHHNSNLLLFAWFHSCDEVKEVIPVVAGSSPVGRPIF